jgi:hypothetical protein
MVGILSGVLAGEESILSAIADLNDGTIDDAVAHFAEEFRFSDRGLGLEFTDRERLGQFIEKKRELYPGTLFRTSKTFAAGEYVIAEWSLEYALKEPFYGNTLRDVPVSLHGVSVVRAQDGKVIEWSDYYDGVTARRTALASYFTEWMEY